MFSVASKYKIKTKAEQLKCKFYILKTFICVFRYYLSKINKEGELVKIENTLFFDFINDIFRKFQKYKKH